MGKKDLTFIDLFAGIGGFHLAFHRLGGRCVFASEKDVHARKTYEHNFKDVAATLFQEGLFNEDIRTINPMEIPDFDVLCAGFPCQPFSQAGYKRGFKDNHRSERGNMFFNIAEIIAAKRPKAFFLENVRGLVTHDGGKTFKVIREVLEKELGYSFYYKIVRASDHGLPQLRPRAFMVGFRDDDFVRQFTFPKVKPLKFNMSDVWEGNCSREIGYTLRVGGRGCKIDDRRNWDAYLVDGAIRRLGIPQAKKMQGFPKDFEFPVSNTQAIKQLGNSVAVDAVQAIADQLLKYLDFLEDRKPMEKTTKNKGEWSELLVFVKLLNDQQVYLSDKNLNATADYFRIKKVSNENLTNDLYLIDKKTIHIKNKETGTVVEVQISDILNGTILTNLKNAIVNGKKTFTIPSFNPIKQRLKIDHVKGGNSNQKADILLDISHQDFAKQNERFGIKSYLGNKPTLLNASGNTNFIFEVQGLSVTKIDEINQINTRTKLKDRLDAIEKQGGTLVYKGAEKATMAYNLKLSDSLMPEIIGEVLMIFYKKRIVSISDIVDAIEVNQQRNRRIDYGDIISLKVKIKNFLIDALLGFFAGTKWDGGWTANGMLVMKKDGDLVGFHLVDLNSLKDFLFENIKLDTPSTTRHRFGHLYKEDDHKLYFKLNLQLRF